MMNKSMSAAQIHALCRGGPWRAGEVLAAQWPIFSYQTRSRT
jgi:hypothetical protein